MFRLCIMAISLLWQPFFTPMWQGDKYVDGLNSRNISITYLNLGAGLGIDYDESTLHPIADFKTYFDTYRNNLTCLKKIGPNYNQNKNITLHFELGRSLIAQSGNLISKVIYIKKGIKKKFAILDDQN